MKVICDVCGTTFPETATHCPICGCAKSSAAQTVAGDDMQTNPEATTANTYAKGGRFAKNNVKRNSRSKAPEGRYSADRNRQNNSQESNKGLIAVVIVLLLAIVMVVVYIGVNVFLSDLGGNNNNGDAGQSTGEYQGSTGADGQGIPCTSIKLNTKLVELQTANESYALAILSKEPANTTDTVIFTSSDPSVATVDSNGLILPVGYGQAIITVTCGTASDQCTVISTVGEPPATTQPESTGPALPDGFVLKLETYKGSGEITIAAEGDSHQLYKEIMGVKASDITWTTSDPAVATVENGKVVGVDRGTCTITATIGDQTATCFVRCPFDAADPTPYEISQGSATIAQGESFNLSLKDKETGANIQGIEWKASKEGIVEIDGNKITGGTVSKLTGVDVYTEYEGVKYTCKVYVKSPEE